MEQIDRTKISDAAVVVERLFDSKANKQIMLSFLAEAIIIANNINNDNWNLNLTKDGKSIRFNVGQVYCIEIHPNHIKILVLRNLLPHGSYKKMDIVFRGYKSKKEPIESEELSVVPDSLVKVLSSVTCIITHDNLKKSLDILLTPNREFLKFAISNTKILPNSKEAHSPGFINYLTEYGFSKIKQPKYFEQENETELVSGLSMQELEEKARQASPLPDPIAYTVMRRQRNPYIAQLVKKQSKGVCHDCKKPAPFVNKQTHEPFLETHHVIPLAEGGTDSIENVIALCPNCHRKRHHG